MNADAANLARSAGVEDELMQESLPEIAWIEVVRKMESVYSDLVTSQIEIERKNAAIEEAHQFIRSTLRSMTDVLIACDLNGRVVEVNKALQDLSGEPKEALLGRALVDLFTDDCRETATRLVGVTASDVVEDCEISLRGADGEAVLLSVNASSRIDRDRRRAGTVLIGRPIGELRRAYSDLNRAHEDLKQTQAQLVHSEKIASLGRLVAGVAHELNNPISFVFGNMRALQSYGQRILRYLQAVEAGATPAEREALRAELRIERILGDMDSLIEGSLEGAERVRDIVQDLRRYSTPQTEAIDTYDLAQTVRTAVQWVTKASKHKPEVVYELPERLNVCGRRGNVHQILVNLVQNAVDVMEDQADRRLTISTSVDDETAVVIVADSGPGIAPEVMHRLFDPFFTTKPVGKGTGLGLSISYGLAVNQGGSLAARNAPGGGAEFVLTVPRECQDRER